MHKAYCWWLIFIGVVALPFLLVTGTHEIALLFPGTVRVEAWRHLASLVFLLTIVPVVFLLVRSKLHMATRAVLVLVLASLFIAAAFAMQMRSMCGDEPVFIGVEPSQQQVARCE